MANKLRPITTIRTLKVHLRDPLFIHVLPNLVLLPNIVCHLFFLIKLKGVPKVVRGSGPHPRHRTIEIPRRTKWLFVKNTLETYFYCTTNLKTFFEFDHEFFELHHRNFNCTVEQFDKLRLVESWFCVILRRVVHVKFNSTFRSIAYFWPLHVILIRFVRRLYSHFNGLIKKHFLKESDETYWAH